MFGGWHLCNFDGKNLIKFFFLLPTNDVYVWVAVLLSLFFHMLNGMPQLLTVDIIDLIIGPSFN